MLQVILPLKAPERAKSRLAGSIADTERRALVEAMAMDVVEAVLADAAHTRLTVVGPAASWRRLLPRSPSLGLLHEERPCSGDLNGLLRHAVEVENPGRTLVLHGDLPFLTTQDVCAVRQKLRSNELVLCPDTAGEGTNGLAFHASSMPEFCFGRNSFAAHRDSADRARRQWTTLERAGFARDIDTPADLLGLLDRVESGEKVGPRTACWISRHAASVRNSSRSVAPIPSRSGLLSRMHASAEPGTLQSASADENSRSVPL